MHPSIRLLFIVTGFLILTNPARVVGSDNAPFFIEGYASQLSVAPGDDIGFHVSTSAPKFKVEISRAGEKPEVVWQKKDLPGLEHPVPEDASANGCRWPESFRIPVAKNWRSGFYLVKFQIEDMGGVWTHRGHRTAESTAWFVVRAAEPGSRTKILLQLCTNTYNAYNNWGGFSFYAYHGLSKNQGHRVSFDRPGRFQFPTWEEPFVVWAEHNGYVLDYAVNSDLEFHPEILYHYRLVLSVGHDEYWSGPMRDSLETFISKGGNVAFFSGNSVCWQVRSEDNGRALTCWKQNFHSDPIYQTREFSTLSTLWSHHLVKRPENQLTGV
ncbi:MAG TPA: N,N-dimethylformamidase beta subunit family domain-containing protein, partial [Verrucomicrobiaceae bacterium]